jgi:hypothetical protein
LLAATLPSLAALLLLGAGCESSDPETTPTTTSGDGGQAGAVVACEPDGNVAPQDAPSCEPIAGDYVPGSTTDGWDACVSDDDAYHPFDASISSVARVGAFVAIADLLAFGQSASPSAQAFLDARLAYTTDEGLESRVSRREDEHYPAAPEACNALTAAELAQYPDRCVGPAQIQPLLNEAFEEGIDGYDPVRNAARIEAGLLWFLYESVYKEATTCATTAKDCDSSYAYYTGGEPRDGGLGLAAYVDARSPQAHDRVWDGLLAVRCWRDLDNPTGEAANLTLQAQALAQLDTALLRGIALIVRQRALQLPCDAAWETVRILGPVLDREAKLREPAMATELRNEVTKASQDGVDVDALVTALDALFPCP